MSRSTMRPRQVPKKMADYVFGHTALVIKKTGHVNKKRERDDDNQQMLADVGITTMRPTNYLASPLDKPELVLVKPVNLLKEIRGEGLFAKDTIPAKTCIGEYTGVKYSTSEFDKLIKRNKKHSVEYAMNVDDEVVVDAVAQGNFTRYVNFSDVNANVEFAKITLHGKPVVKLVTLRQIHAGEQLLVDYDGSQHADAGEVYLFLNPADNENDTYHIYINNRASYVNVSMFDDVRLPELLRSYKLSMPIIMKALVKNEILQNHFANADETLVNLPCFTHNAQGYLHEFYEKDTVTPLMLACYLGQLENVIWLIRHGARIDQQQNFSGQSALNFALSGYEKSVTPLLFIGIIKTLLSSGANLRVHDREDNTFLHQAALVLSDDDFIKIIACVKHNRRTNFCGIMDFINNANDDLISHCARHKQYSKLTYLLTQFPNYLEKFVLDNNHNTIANFKEVIADYTDAEKKRLSTHLKSANLLTKELQTELSLTRVNKNRLKR